MGECAEKAMQSLMARLTPVAGEEESVDNEAIIAFRNLIIQEERREVLMARSKYSAFNSKRVEAHKNGINDLADALRRSLDQIERKKYV